MENSVDPVHTEWLHGHHYEFMKEAEGVKVTISTHHEKIDFREFEWGMTKHRLLTGGSEDSDDWKVGHPIVFPNMLAVGNGDEHLRSYNFQIRVPMDDENTLHIWYHAYKPPAGTVVSPHLLGKLHIHDVPIKDANGEFIVDYVDGEDIMAWISQGRVADRSKENLGASDWGVVMYRRMLKREAAKVANGEDPKGVIRDAERNRRIDLPNEKKKHHFADGFGSIVFRTQVRYSQVARELVEVFEGKGARSEPELAPVQK
jgi:5,5'-dehydrodivanillate O-demethylase